MHPIISKIFSINRIQLLGFFQEEDQVLFSLLIVKKERDELVLKSQKDFRSFESLLAEIDTSIPLIFQYNGKGVLYKKLSDLSEEDNLWRKNIDYNSIYYTSFKTDDSTFMGFCRKESVDIWLNRIKDANILILDFYIGVFSIGIISNFLSNTSNVIGPLEVDVFNHEVVGFKKTDLKEEVQYSLFGSIFNNFNLPLYACGLQYFVKSEAIIKTKSEERIEEDFLFKKGFTKLGMIMLVFFFLSLLGSYLLTQYYIGKNADLNAQNIYLDKAYKGIEVLEKEKEDKKNMIKESGILTRHFLSYYNYQILSSVPETIILNSLYVAPLKEEIKDKHKVLITSTQIDLEGQTFDEDEFDKWLIRLKKMQWVEKLEIKSIKKNKKGETHFLIILNNK